MCTNIRGKSSSVSENYVRLNLKKSHYSRGGVKKSGSFYKRQKWKKNKSSRCFKCGQTGHWAKSCTAQNNSDIDGGKVDLPCGPAKPSMTDSLVSERPQVRI